MPARHSTLSDLSGVILDAVAAGFLCGAVSFAKSEVAKSTSESGRGGA